MLEELGLLIRIQNVDAELTEIEAEKGDLPEQIENLNLEIVQNRAEIESIVNELARIQESKRLQQRAIEEARERLKKSQGIIYSVKTTREYDAISSEIEQAKSQVAVGEKDTLELNAREELLLRQQKERQGKLSEVESEHRDRQLEMAERLSVSMDSELKLRHEREKIAVRLKKPVLAHYERIRKIRDGVGVSKLSDGACSYCFSTIPPQRQAEIRRMNDMILCEVCGCLLVVDENH